MPEHNEDRDKQIIDLAGQGVTHSEIARQYGVTRQRISQIISRADPDRHAKERKFHKRKIAELQTIVANPPPARTAIGKVMFDPTTGEVVRDESVRVAAVREQRLQRESMRKVDASTPDEQQLAELNALLAWARTLAPEIRRLREENAVLRYQLASRDGQVDVNGWR